MSNQFTNPWTNEEINFLKENGEKMSAKTISNFINKGRSSIVEKRNLLGIVYINKGAGKKWKEEEIEFLKKNYEEMTYEELGKKISRTKSSVSRKVISLGLKKVKRKNNWTQREIKFLKENISSINYNQIANKLNRSAQACRTKAHDLNLVSYENRNSYKIRNNFKEFIKNNYKTKTDSELADLIGCSVRTVTNFRVKNNMRKLKIKNMTEIERIISELLNSFNIPFEYEPNMFGLKPDFYIKKFNLIIEVQGDYFHCNPLIFKQGPINKMQEKQILHDYTKKCIYLDKKINLLYLWEDEIINNIDKIKEKIKKGCRL
ncbi:MAG: hypothetical protein B6I28_03370 [Fusobacteriia bacterium 4572_132]|nr:MAG: hypothetical protein B6I28_03370 [Fusobacteriia bacterium 4572_132]